MNDQPLVLSDSHDYHHGVLPVIIVYSGFVITFLGAIFVLKPLGFLGIHSRLSALWFFAIGPTLVAVGWLLPAREVRIGNLQTHLDEFIPVFHFNEFHSTRIHAPAYRIFKAIKELRADEIFLFRTLTWIRRLGSSSGESILSPARDSPILDVAMRSGFVLLAEEPEREFVLGTAVIAPPDFRGRRHPVPEDFKTIRAPGFAVAAMNFRLEHVATGETLLTTETRIHATDRLSRRRFARYWRLIYPGSSLIRWMWLRAIRKRAEHVIAS